ncbi:hypothetical protein C8Q74DRAFT_1296800 [Fomes fomentarius]|nr:hypothetical protein C8Q74DRAFT_1296800 [Fomes fomentarius]
MREASDISETDTSSIDEDFDRIDSPPPEEISRKITAETSKLHGKRCMVCGDKDITYYRIVAQHGDAPGENPFYWLWRLGLVDSSLTENHPTAIMILCAEHAQDYDNDVWRWIPSEATRRGMFHANGIPSDFDPTFDPPRKEHFDLIVFLPNDMHQKGSFRIEDDVRVQKSYRELCLNPYVALASALPMLVSVYMPLPDEEILHIEEECLQIRKIWNGLVPSGMSECKVKVYRRDMSSIPNSRGV